MTVFDFISITGVAVAIIGACVTIFVSVAVTNDENRETVLTILNNPSPAKGRLDAIANAWVIFFEWIFGKKIFSKRQLFTIPIYTFCVAGVFFCIWIAYIYIFQNPQHLLKASIPLGLRQAITDYYHKGYLASLGLDILTIQLAKICIRIGKKQGFSSIKFCLSFVFSIVFSYFLFSLVVLGFRIDDMIWVYMNVAPHDPLPIVPYQPIENFSSSLRLFGPSTFIYMTSRGAVSSYFMPEPLIFYCAVVGQLSLIFLVFAFQVAALCDWIRRKAVWFVNKVNDPHAQASAILTTVWLVLFSLPILVLILWAIFSKI